MFFLTHIEDQSLRGPLLKAQKPMCKNQGGWGAPHLIDIKRVGWRGSTCPTYISYRTFSYSIYRRWTRFLIKTNLRAPMESVGKFPSLRTFPLNVKTPSLQLFVGPIEKKKLMGTNWTINLFLHIVQWPRIRLTSGGTHWKSLFNSNGTHRIWKGFDSLMEGSILYITSYKQGWPPP